MNIDAAPNVPLPPTDDGLTDWLDQPGPSLSDRSKWPYLANPQAPGLRNGRETGAWICGHLFGRQMHGERGLRCVVLQEHLDGAITALVAAGCTVQKCHDIAQHPEVDEGPSRSVIDVWA